MAKKKKRTAEQIKRQALEKVGIKPTTSLLRKSVEFVKEIVKEKRKEIRKERSKQLAAEKEAALVANNIPYKKSDLKKSWEKINEKIENPKGGSLLTTHVEEWLYIGFANVTGEPFIPSLLAGKTLEEIKEIFYTHEWDAYASKIGSADMIGVFKFMSGTKEECLTAAKVYYERGYNLTGRHIKMQPEQFERVGIWNDWTEEKFFRIAATCITQMKELDKQVFATFMRDYCNDNGLTYLK